MSRSGERERSRWALTVVASAGVWVAASVARAEAPLPSAQELGAVEVALQRGAFSEAIAQLELWSDQGVVHPDLSFDRGVAYLGRAESPAQRRADFGQAVAAFEEAVALDPSDAEAAQIIESVRTKLSERRKRDTEGVVARPRLARALLGLIGENLWAGFGAFGAVLLCLGLAARLALHGHQQRLAGAIAAVFGVGAALLGGGMALVGARLRAHATPAVVIAEEARLHDGAGRPIAAARGASTLGEASDRVPEGTLVHIAETRGALVQIEWGDGEAWLSAREVRRLAAPR